MYLQRNFLILIFFFVSFLVWKSWQENFNIHTNSKLMFHKSIKSNLNHINSPISKKIFIKTDVLYLTINLRGGDIEKTELLKFKESLNSSKALVLLDTKSNYMYQVQSGLVGKDGIDDFTNDKRPFYRTKNNSTYFELLNHERELRVSLEWTSKEGIIYKKIFILQPNRYDVVIKYEISNNTSKSLKLSMLGQLRQNVTLSKTKPIYKNNFALQTFRGAAYSTNNQKYKKYTFESILNKDYLNITTNKGWIAMIQQYFVTAWIPDDHYYNTFYTNSASPDVVEIGYRSNDILIPSYSTFTLNSKLWIGPEIQDKMAILAQNLDLTVDYGFLWFLSQPLFKLLKFLYGLVGNWGFSIVLITFIMKGITFPLTKSQFKTMTKMRELQPKINNIKNTYKNNKQKMSEEMIFLYKKEKVNPLGGCFPLLIQMPIFLALYYMLISSVELRHAPFIWWINDLSNQDPYYVLPVLMGISMFFIQKTTPNNVTDPLQRKIMYFMPVIFTTFFLWFPSGLVLYYIVSNLVTIFQQKFLLTYYKIDQS